VTLYEEALRRQDARRAAREVTDNGRSDAELPRAVALELGGKLVLAGQIETAAGPDVDPDLQVVYERAREDNPHHLWLQGRFVQAEKANANGAYWSVSDLELGQPSVKHGPMNWLHDPHRVVGTLVDSKLVAPNLEAAGSNLGPRVGTHLAVAGVMWRHLYPRLAEQVEEASAGKKLAFSMECTSDAVTCSTGEGRTGCGQAYPFRQIALEPASVCEHLRERSSLRRFVDPVFLGGALIVPPVKPAWREADASVMEAATKEAERTWVQGEAAGHTQQSWAELVLAAASVAAA
jgi:hypothetical protein